MKKYFFALSAALICLLISSCAGGGCSIEGTWKVSDVKVESSTLPESIIKMMETEYKNSIYQFNSDGTMSITSSNSTPNTGKYTLDLAGNSLKWTDDSAGAENALTINSCSDEAFSLTQRMPSDPAQAESFKITMTIVPSE
ncbi:MAG: hypothetical protein R2825_14880 [Saprospiraceae bacterium]